MEAELKRTLQFFSTRYRLREVNYTIRRPYFHLLPYVSTSISYKDRIKRIKVVLPKIDLREVTLLPLSLFTLYHAFSTDLASFIPFAISFFPYLYLRFGNSDRMHEISHLSRESWLFSYENIKVRKTCEDGVTYKKLAKEESSPTFMERIMRIKKSLKNPKILLGKIKKIKKYPLAFIKKAREIKEELENGLIIDEAFANYETGKMRKGKIPQMGEILKYFPPFKKYARFAENFESMNSRKMELNSLEKIEEKMKNLEGSIKELIRTELEDIESSDGFKEVLENPPPIIPKYHLIKQLFRTVF